MYKNLRRSAYHLAGDGTSWAEDFRALSFPEHWHAGLLELHNYGREEDKQRLTLPTQPARRRAADARTRCDRPPQAPNPRGVGTA